MIRVLHVHEDAEQLRYMKLLLEASERDIEVESLDNPADVPIRLLNGTFDAVLSGCWFPEMNEIELGVAVGRVKDIPFIMYNGEGREKAARDTLRRGVDDIVGKDVNPGHVALADKLVEAVNRNRRNRRREVSLNVFRALNLGSDLQSSLGETLRVIQEDMRIDAVGIRLQEGDDYPYFVFEGFHDKHILLENDLCATDLEGQMMRDDVGNPVLDCMCGNILRGRFNPSKPFFTERGSFWTNSTTEHHRGGKTHHDPEHLPERGLRVGSPHTHPGRRRDNRAPPVERQTPRMLRRGDDRIPRGAGEGHRGKPGEGQ